MPSTAEEQPTRLAAAYGGIAADELAQRLAVPVVVAFDVVESTLDVAHARAAAGAPAGTLILADAQTAGRGRLGRRWQSEAGAGIWLTLIERPRDGGALGVLSLRVGLALAPALEPFTSAPVQLKWPNDVYVGGGKLAGVLVEARWKADILEWVAIGVGVNVRPPAAAIEAGAIPAALRQDVSRLDVLAAIIPAVRVAANLTGPLNSAELAAFAQRDMAAGKRCVEPGPGRVRGIAADGALLVEHDAGWTQVVRAGSLVLQPEQEAP